MKEISYQDYMKQALDPKLARSILRQTRLNFPEMLGDLLKGKKIESKHFDDDYEAAAFAYKNLGRMALLLRHVEMETGEEIDLPSYYKEEDECLIALSRWTFQYILTEVKLIAEENA